MGPGSRPPRPEGALCLWKITGVLCRPQQRPVPSRAAAGRREGAAGQRTRGLSARGKGAGLAGHGGGTDTPPQEVCGFRRLIFPVSLFSWGISRQVGPNMRSSLYPRAPQAQAAPSPPRQPRWVPGLGVLACPPGLGHLAAAGRCGRCVRVSTTQPSWQSFAFPIAPLLRRTSGLGEMSQLHLSVVSEECEDLGRCRARDHWRNCYWQGMTETAREI